MYDRQASSDPDALLTEIKAAAFLSLSSRTLQAWRSNDAGPAFVRAGRAIRYRRSDLIEWMNTNTCSPRNALQRGTADGHAAS